MASYYGILPFWQPAIVWICVYVLLCCFIDMANKLSLSLSLSLSLARCYTSVNGRLNVITRSLATSCDFVGLLEIFLKLVYSALMCLLLIGQDSNPYESILGKHSVFKSSITTDSDATVATFPNMALKTSEKERLALSRQQVKTGWRFMHALQVPHYSSPGYHHALCGSDGPADMRHFASFYI